MEGSDVESSDVENSVGDDEPVTAVPVVPDDEGSSGSDTLGSDSSEVSAAPSSATFPEPSPEPSDVPDASLEPEVAPEPEPSSTLESGESSEPSTVTPTPEPAVTPEPVTETTDPLASTDPTTSSEPTLPTDSTTLPPEPEPSSEPVTEPAPEPEPGVEPLAIVASVPAPGAASVDPATNLVLTFNDLLELGNGTIGLSLLSDDAPFEIVAVDDPRVTLDGDELTLDLDGILAGSTQYYVTLSAGAVARAGGEDFTGITTSSELSFTTAALAAPGNVAAGLMLWLDAAYAASVKGASGVRLWADRSGQGNNVSQAVAAQQPTLFATGIAGKSTLRFAGGDDVLLAPAAFALTSFEGFVVWQSSIASPTTVKAAIIRNNNNFELDHGHSAAAPRNSVSSYFGAAAGWYESKFTPPALNTPYLWNFTLDDATHVLAARTQGGGSIPMTTYGVRGTPSVSVAAPQAGSLFSVGNDEDAVAGFTGDIAEILLYDRPLSLTERASVVAYLKAKWAFELPVCSGGGNSGVQDNAGNCFVLVTTPASWAAAQTACTGYGAGWNLASPRSGTSNGVIASLLLAQGVARAWLAGTDVTTEGAWLWGNDSAAFWTGASAASGGAAVGSAFDYWATAEPSGGSAINCMSQAGVNSPGDGVWFDDICSTQRPYVCQGPLP